MPRFGNRLRLCRPAGTGPCRRYSTRSYGSTIPNVRIGRHTRVIFQGFTGKQATANAKESLQWGTNIVGGVTPGRTGEHLGLSVLPTVRKAMDTLKPDATGIYVAAHQAAAAIEEAIEAEVPLVVAVAEHIPLHDMLRIHSILKTQSASRLVGPNSPGIVSAIGRCRIGFQPLPCLTPGRVGVIAKSGTLSYEAFASTSRAGLGQSLCIGVGGDILPGTDLVESLGVLEQDPDTDAIALIGEIGGSGELEAAAWIAEYRSRTAAPKPVVALVAGVCEAPGHVMGHAGAFRIPGEPDAKAKIDALQAAGATMVHHPSKFGAELKRRLGRAQQRWMHTARRRPEKPSPPAVALQRRHLYLSEGKSLDLLRRHGVDTSPMSGGRGASRLLAVGIDRSARSPCIAASPDGGSVRSFPLPFDPAGPAAQLAVDRVAAHLQLGRAPQTADSLRRLIAALMAIFYEHEAYYVEVHVAERLGGLEAVRARIGLDGAGRNKKPADDNDSAGAVTREAARHGIVYLRLPGAGLAIGTVANGAGLAMNTVDALAAAGGLPANFLDTGGKATAETVGRSFAAILDGDARVRAVLVNIFGGLTLGDVIARGVVEALEQRSTMPPVVVRIRGTNEHEARRVLAESGLPLYAVDDFDEAAAKAIELAGRQT